MKHFVALEFWDHHRQLPSKMRKLADKNFALLKTDSRHASIRLTKVGVFWPVCIGSHYRALAREQSEGLAWFWIGPHSTYDHYT